MAKAKPWTEWLGYSSEKLLWTVDYLTKNDIQILYKASVRPDEKELRKLVIDTLKRAENNLVGKEVLRRMKGTYAAKDQRRSKRFKGYVSTTICMKASTKDQLIALQKQLCCSSQDETIEFLIENAADIDHRLEQTYKDEIAELRKRPNRRASIPKTELGKKINAMQTRVDVSAQIAKARKEMMEEVDAKFQAIENSIKQSEAGSANTPVQDDATPSPDLS